MTFVMEMEKIFMLLAALYSLGDSKIIKPMNKWICDYCAMGKTNNKCTFPKAKVEATLLVHWLLSKIEVITRRDSDEISIPWIYWTLRRDVKSQWLLIIFSRSRNRSRGVRGPDNVPVFHVARVYHGVDSLHHHVQTLDNKLDHNNTVIRYFVIMSNKRYWKWQEQSTRKLSQWSEKQPGVQSGVTPSLASRGHAQPPGQNLQLGLQQPNLKQKKIELGEPKKTWDR